jgi:hypothetical protein
VGTCEQLVKNCSTPPISAILIASSGKIPMEDGGSGALISVPQPNRLRIKETSGFPGYPGISTRVVPRGNAVIIPRQRLNGRCSTA